MNREELDAILAKARAEDTRPDLRNADLSDMDLCNANLRNADLSGANLSGANLGNTSFCGATIDGAIIADKDIGGPGHILCALTDAEWDAIRAGREKEKGK